MCTIDFYSGCSEYLRIENNGEELLFALTHINLDGKQYAVIRDCKDLGEFESFVKPYIMENEILIYDHDPILKNIIVKDDYIITGVPEKK